MDLNHITKDQTGLDFWLPHVEQLRRHLYPNGEKLDNLPREKWRCRYAPSIIVRGEAEVFGLAMPRFAHRISLSDDPNDLSFVNARRLQVLKSAPQLQKWGERRGGASRRVVPDSLVDRSTKDELEAEGNTPAISLGHASPVADSFLKIPKHLVTAGYRALEVDLGTAYGEVYLGKDYELGAEPSAGLPGFRATPYMKHIRLAGGGMCAQACCFMANCLLSGKSDHISGLAEITALANEEFERFAESDDFDVFELRISGLHTRGILRYFPKVRLKATFQRTPPSSTRNPMPDAMVSQEWGAILRAYLRSNMPVLLPVDLERMAGACSDKMADDQIWFNEVKPIYGRREGNLEVFSDAHKAPVAGRASRKSHLIMVSGFHADNADEFLIHDPAVLPFVPASVFQLEAVGNYTDEDCTAINARQFITVTPEAVTLPLADWKSNEQWQPGLVSRIHIMQGLAGDVPKVPRKHRLRDIRLLTVSELRAIIDGEPEDDTLLAFRDGIAAVMRGCLDKLVTQHGWSLDRCLWVQNVREPADSVWLYDAEQSFPAPLGNDRSKKAGPPKPTEDEKRGFLRAVIWNAKKNDAWQCRADFVEVASQPSAASSAQQPPPRPTAASSPTFVPAVAPAATGRAEHPPELALISSFSIHGSARALEDWPCGISHAEIYAFMNLDPALNVAIEPGDSLASPLYERLAEMSQDAVEDLAGHISGTYAARKKRLVAMASFIPEITDANHNQADKAMRGVGNLIKLAHAINGAGKGRGWGPEKNAHRIRTLELVAGSLMDGLWPGLGRDSPASPLLDVYVANVSSRRHAISRLIKGLVRNKIESLVADPRTPGGLRLAFEFEPSTMGVLGNKTGLRSFAEELRRTGLYRFVGFNLDIPHWDFLGNITPEEILSPEWETVRNLVFHAHVSDHTKGHFGDSPPMWLNPRRHFERWFRVLSHCPKFDGFLSIEMEAVKSDEILAAAVDAAASIRRSAFALKASAN